MPFNTRNPVPSGDLRDLDDNARNIDAWANDKTKLSHPDRFGVERRTWHGIEKEAQLNIQQAIDAKNAAQEAAMMSGFSKYADTLAQLESGIGTDYIEGDVVMVFQDESRGDTSSIFKIESGAAEFKLTFDKTRQDLLSFTGNISADAEWSDIPAHSDPAFDVQAQALAERTEYLNANKVHEIQDSSVIPQSPTGSPTIFIRGYFENSGKGAGFLRWEEGADYAADGVSVFGGTGGRWIRDFRQFISSSEAGIIGNGTSEDLSRIQKLIEVASKKKLTIGFEPGNYLLYRQLWAEEFVSLSSPFRGAVRLRVIDGVDSAVFGADPDIPPKSISLKNLILDGNRSNAPKSSAISVCAWAGIDDFVAEFCDFTGGTGYGLGFQGRPLSSLPAWQQEYAKRIYLDACRFYQNGSGAPGETHDGLDCKFAEEIWLSRSTAFSNGDKGIDIRGRYVHLHGNNSESNAGDGIGIQTFHSDMGINTDTFLDMVGNTTRVNGAQGLQISTGATSAISSLFGSISNQTSVGDNSASILIEHSSATVSIDKFTSRASKYIGLRVKSCEELNVNGASIKGALNHGASFEVGANAVSLTNFKSKGNGQFGVSNTSGLPIHFGGACDLSGNTSGPINSAGSSSFVSPIAGAVPTSATPTIANTTSTLQMPMGLDCAEVTSTVAMNNIAQPYQGRLITVVAGTGGLTFNPSSALQTTSGSSVTVATGASITFRHANEKWHQV